MIEFRNVEIKYGDFVAIQNFKPHHSSRGILHIFRPFWLWKDHNIKKLSRFYSALQRQHSGRQAGNHFSTHRKKGNRNCLPKLCPFPTMTVFENITFGLRVKKNDPGRNSTAGGGDCYKNRSE